MCYSRMYQFREVIRNSFWSPEGISQKPKFNACDVVKKGVKRYARVEQELRAADH